ncbi:hypothetical protein [Desulfoluna butyratoxydans]|uniref:Uncharacterized protein n=1 Tax=Desulfoluna butyratoxydans TaxID=231438 RepID=A0A4U8YT22_9BACT|nr:hypothetical protein [Desulfoluna butyratoxydans]VFQ47120.1 hypothetical protein MSL71_48060 [Desulfoluna butyratoxydans]
MLSSDIYDTLTLPEDAKSYIDGLDDYDDPYFICIKVNKDEKQATGLLKKALNSKNEAFYSVAAFAIGDGLFLLSIDAEKEDISDFANGMKITCTDHGLVAHISVFRHNCLGEAMETFKWCTQLLEEVMKGSPDASAIGVNDFTDRGNWPGIAAYQGQQA